MTEAPRALCFTSPHAAEVETPGASIYRSKTMSGSKRKSDVATVLKKSVTKRTNSGPSVSGEKKRGMTMSNAAEEARDEEYSDADDDKMVIK